MTEQLLWTMLVPGVYTSTDSSGRLLAIEKRTHKRWNILFDGVWQKELPSLKQSKEYCGG